MRRAEPELFKDKVEVSLDGRQIFYLFFGGAVIACLVFVLGVMVGKRVEARSHVHAQASTSVVEDPLAALDQLSADADDLAFPEALTGAGEKPLGSVDQVLQASADEAEAAADVAAEPDKKSEPEARPEKKAAAAPDDDKPTEADDKAAKAAAAAKAIARAENKDEKVWTLQLSSFQDRAEADSFHSKLVDAGYDPYIVEAQVPDKGTWYRVRLGSYGTYDDAIAAKKKFEAAQQIIAYVTRVRR
jgi:cell division septation protein DedD